MESPRVTIEFFSDQIFGKKKTRQIHFSLNNAEETRNKLHNLSVTWNEAI